MGRNTRTGAAALLVAAALSTASCDGPDEVRIEPSVFLYVAETAEIAAADGYSGAYLLVDEDAAVPLYVDYTSVDDQRQYRVEYAITGEAVVDGQVEYTTELLQVTRIATGEGAGATEVAKWRKQGSVREKVPQETLTVSLATGEPRVFFWIGDA
ncbi:MAG TPA: hypothetical protein VIK91_04380 [Nannocystis sp.]